MALIPAGYRETEAGVIPEDWNAVPLSRLGQFKNGINKGSEAFGHGSPFVNLMDVFGVSSIESGDALGLVKTSEVEQKIYNLKRGDVIFIRSSVKPSGVGLTAVVEVDLPRTVYSGFLIRFRDNDALDIGFKRHCFYSEKFRSKLIGASSVSANTNINQDNLRKLLIALPPADEQRAIATALSDVDALIAKLDQLIAKKRDLKQAAMQQLLTGQTRLPGFGGEWGVSTVEELEKLGAVKLSRGNVISKKDIEVTPGDCPIYSSSVKNNGVFGTYGKYMFNEELITWSVDGGGHFFYRPKHRFSVTNVCGYMRVETKLINYKYLALRLQHLHSGMTFDYTTKAHPSVIRKAYAVPLPQIDEQTAIATVLSDMGAEIAILETRRDKTLALKQGMMQELLTGRIRLPLVAAGGVLSG